MPTRGGHYAEACKQRTKWKSCAPCSTRILDAPMSRRGSRVKNSRHAKPRMTRVRRGAVRASTGAKWFPARASGNFRNASCGGESCGSECGRPHWARRIRRPVSRHASAATPKSGVSGGGGFCQHRLIPGSRKRPRCLGVAHRVSRNRTPRKIQNPMGLKSPYESWREPVGTTPASCPWPSRPARAAWRQIGVRSPQFQMFTEW